MWSKEEAKNRRVSFFTNFGIFMKKHAGDYGEKIRWVNYRTGVSAIRFKIEAHKNTSTVAIDIVNKDEGVREVFYEQFEEFKTILNNSLTDLQWHKSYRVDSGVYIAKIFTQLEGPSINNESDWGKIYRFYEKNLIGLHEFWEISQDVFKDLEG